MRKLGVLIAVLALAGAGSAGANTPVPTSVTIAGSLQSELGCPGDWDPSCAATHLDYDVADDVWQQTFDVPPGAWEYKAPLNDSWDENYGANATRDGANIALSLASATAVKFFYDHKTHWVTDNHNAVIATAPGSFQSELGCPGDWQPDCLRSWLEDPDGDGVYMFETAAIPPGTYEVKVAINESWDENYGAGGIRNGPNIPFTVALGDVVRFSYVAATHVLTVTSGPAPEPQPASVAIPGSFGTELGCLSDWEPSCPSLAFDAEDVVWQASYDVPVGNWEYKATLNGSWDENYGANATRNGANIAFSLTEPKRVKFYYSNATHWIASNADSTIATAPGSYQSELGCTNDWDPGCLRSWLQDPDGDGIYTFETRRLPAGSYEVKTTINESWDENYGAGGVRNGPNIAFTVPADAALVKFRYDGLSHVLSVDTGAVPPPPDTHRSPNNVEWDGLRHDSRSDVYRTPGGAVPAGSSVKLRFRTFHDDVTSVKARIYDLNTSSQALVSMTPVATDVSCYQGSLASETCDFWQATITRAQPDNLWYRFIVTDGTKTAYYADDTAALDGGLGTPTDNPVDNSYALMFYAPGFTTPAWMRDAVLYQIFPDRFRNGNVKNDPKTGDVRYDDPVLKLPWNTKPEGYCRSYDDRDTSCPWRFDSNPPSWSPTVEGPRGRDYMGGDLRGVTDKLDYLKNLGVTAIYFNPIFASKSNHGYDTADYRAINPYFGSQKDFKDLVDAAAARGIKVILDGVFNHMSSDSPFFDRYHHYAEVGACESLASPWRSWFTFTTSNVPCGSGDYSGWFGFDSIPVLDKTNPDVQKYFVNGAGSVAWQWLNRGAAGWRLDVMGDSTFPNGYWETFRQTVKGTDPNAVIVGELWQKDSTTLRYLRGDRADSTMNYRLRDAVLGLLAPQGFDGKGLGDSGRQLAPSEFASRLESIVEDYPRGVTYDLMNLLDSHDTARLLWQLTPGAATTAAKEQNAANVAEGKQRQRLAALIQFTVPGAPTIYYGDEVGMTGADDPDDRRTYPWADTGGSPDAGLYDAYRSLAQQRRANPALTDGDFRVLLTDDSAGVVAYGRKTQTDVALAAINRSTAPRTLSIPVAGYIPDGTVLRFTDGSTATVDAGALLTQLLPLTGKLAAGQVVAVPDAPLGAAVTAEDFDSVTLQWAAVGHASAYAVYRSPLSGGGYVKAGDVNGTTFTDTGLKPARTYYYVVRAVNAGGESANSNEVSAMPHYTIGWANTQWPPTLTHTISVVNRTDNVYGQVWIDGVTNAPGPTPTLRAQLGFGPDGSNPDGSAAWTWVDAAFNVDAGNNDEFVASMLPDSTGRFDYAFRYTTTNGRDWVYADLDGIGNGYSSAQAGDLVVNPSADTTAPATPSGLHVVDATPVSIDIAWDAVSGDSTLYGYEVLRDGKLVARLTGTSYSDGDVTEGQTYSYSVRAVDTSFNRSPASAPVSATAQQRIVDVTFNVTVPSSTDGTGRTVHIAGTLSRLQGGLPDWNPGAVVLTRDDATHWHITLHGYEGTQLEYKYALGDWEHVEKDGACGEIPNRTLTLAYGASGTQTVSDTVLNWRNVSPCGN